MYKLECLLIMSKRYYYSIQETIIKKLVLVNYQCKIHFSKLQDLKLTVCLECVKSFVHCVLK